MPTKPGDRVIALCSAKEGKVQSFGAGVYAGDFIPPKTAGGFNFGQNNPRIDLDNGKTVWGCECWWGSEVVVRKRCEAAKGVVEIDIDESRRQYNAAE